MKSSSIFQASSESLRISHVIARFLCLVGIFYFELSISNLFLTFVFYHIYMSIGLSLMLHRYFSHRSFRFKNSIIENLFTYISILAMRGSPIAWSYLHRDHHEFVDTPNDPHTPHGNTFKFLSLLDRNHKGNQLEIWRIRHLMTKKNLLINKYYWLILFLPLICIASYNLSYVYFGWLLPIVLVQLSINFQNYLGHMKSPLSYINYQTKSSGHSQNNILLWPLYLGEAWHNNHHSHSTHYHYGKEISGKWWEYDPVGNLIKLISK